MVLHFFSKQQCRYANDKERNDERAYQKLHAVILFKKGTLINLYLENVVNDIIILN